MNVLVVRSNSTVSDGRVRRFVSTLLELGHNVEIFAWDRSNTYKIEEKEELLDGYKVKIYIVGIKARFGTGIKNIISMFRFQTNYYKWIKRNVAKYDVIHSCDFDTACISGLITNHRKVKHIYDIFDYYVDAFKIPKCMKAIVERMDIRTIDNADAIIICTESRIEQIQKANPKRVSIVYNSLKLDERQSEMELKHNTNQSDVLKIVYVGVLTDGRLLKEMTEKLIGLKRYELHIGGFGKHAAYFEEISKKYKNIKFYGKLDYGDVLRLECNCDIMVAAYDPDIKNNKYSSPNKFFESLYLGKPIIVSKGTSIDKVITSNDFGVAIDYSGEGFVKGLGILDSKKNSIYRRKEEMLEYYNDNYSWEKMKKRVEKLYCEMENSVK